MCSYIILWIQNSSSVYNLLHRGYKYYEAEKIKKKNQRHYYWIYHCFDWMYVIRSVLCFSP